MKHQFVIGAARGAIISSVGNNIVYESAVVAANNVHTTFIGDHSFGGRAVENCGEKPRTTNTKVLLRPKKQTRANSPKNIPKQ